MDAAFAEPAGGQPPVGVRLVGTPFEDVGNTSTFTFSRLEGAAGSRRLERAVALKVLPTALAGDPAFTRLLAAYP